MDIDKPLDSLIDEKRAERKKTRAARGRGARGAARGSGRGASTAVPAVTTSTGPVRNKYSGNIAVVSPVTATAPASGKPAVPLMADGSKIIVSNLPMDVTENQIRDLFSQTVGPVTKLSLAYDKNGKSTGVATIELRRPGDGQNAYTQYNGRLVDGTKPMKVEILYDPSRAPPPPLNSRIAPAPAAAKAAPVVAASGEAVRGGAGGRGRGGRGRGRGGRGRGRGGKDDRGERTAEDLDADMEDYQKTLAGGA